MMIYDLMSALLSLTAGILTLDIAIRSILAYRRMDDSEFREFTFYMGTALLFLALFFTGRSFALLWGGAMSVIVYIFSALGLFSFLAFFKVMKSVIDFLTEEGR